MADMTETRLREFFDACNARDIDRVASFFTTDAVYLGSLGPDDDGAPFHGAAEVRQGMAAFLNSHTALRYDDIDMRIDGDRGFATWTFRGTKPGAAPYSYRGVDILDFADDLISRKDAFRKERSRPTGS